MFFCRSSHRFHSTLRSVRDYHSSTSLEQWIKSPKQQIFIDTLHPERFADLYVTLPTRDGTHGRPFQPPKPSEPLGYGHHLVFFHPRQPETTLRPDGTESDFCPPPPFTRRMWAGGRFTWNNADTLSVGDTAEAKSVVASVHKKGFEAGKPMLFVNQDIAYTRSGSSTPAIVERRAHVYLPETKTSHRAGLTREVQGLPSNYDFSFSYRPTPTTLFRFSAMTFNGHYIHLDKDYAKQEGYSERLVHGPMTALMLLENVVYHHPELKLASFDYQARNPQLVNQEQTFYGKWLESGTSIFVWCVDEKDVVGMTGKVAVQPSVAS